MGRVLASIVALFFGLSPAPEARAMDSGEAARALEAMSWYTEEYPPYNYKGKGGSATGMAVDILLAAFKKIGVDVKASEIRIAPWNRSYKYIQKRPRTALFSMTYTPERQEIMHFVGPSVPSNVSVIAPKKSMISVKSVADLAKIRIGVVRDDIGDQLIRQQALSSENIVRKNSLKQLFYLLEAGRIDAVAYAAGVFLHSVKRQGLNPADFDEVHVLKEAQLGYAFHRDTDPAVLAHLQNAIDDLRADGTIEKIIAAYSQ